MITLPIAKLQSGMTVVAPIVTKRGQVIAKEGTILNNQLIAKLSFYKIESVSVEDPVVDEPQEDLFLEEELTDFVEQHPVKETVSDQITYTQRLKASPKFQQFQSDYALNMEYLKENFEAIIEGAGAECSDLLLENCSSLFQSKTSLELLDMLKNLTILDDSLYSHSLNVGLISRGIGKWLKLPKSELDVLTLCGLLHDIGKTQITESASNGYNNLTDEQRKAYESHPLLGGRLLRDKGFDQRIVSAAIQHHERADGSGFPRGLMDDEISDFSYIVGIADLYDDLTCARSAQDPVCSFEVISILEKDGLKKYKTQYLLTFLERIANTYNNSRVLLNNAKAGRVVYINKGNLSRPIIEMDDGTILDLSQPRNKDLVIQKIL